MSEYKTFDNVPCGIALGIVLNPLAVVVAVVGLSGVLEGYDVLIPAVFFGTTQLTLTLPAAGLLWRFGFRRVAKGVLLIAALSFSLNSLCCAFEFANR